MYHYQFHHNVHYVLSGFFSRPYPHYLLTNTADSSVAPIPVKH